MAHIEEWFRCPVCNSRSDTFIEAQRCVLSHPIKSELWAVSDGQKGKAVKVFENRAPNSSGSIEWALREAELSDFIQEREMQLKIRVVKP